MASTRLTISLTESQNSELKRLARGSAVSLSQVIREACDQYITNGENVHQSGEDVHQNDEKSQIEAKYLSCLESRVEQLSEQLDKKDQLIESLTNGRLVINSGFRPLQWIRGLLSSR